MWRRAQKAAARQAAAAMRLSLAGEGAEPPAAGGGAWTAAPTNTASSVVAGNVACLPLRPKMETYMDEVTVPRQVYQDWKIHHATEVILVAPTGVREQSSLRINSRGEARLRMNFQRVTKEMPQARL